MDKRIVYKKISTKTSEKIYKVLVKLCSAKDDHYEKETFIYHHSICKDPLPMYNIKLKDNCLIIDIKDIKNSISLENKTLDKDLNKNIILANKIIFRYLTNQCLF
jgi:hypothetical protein